MEYLLKEINIIRKEYEMLKKREEKFNIFSVLHKEHDERRLHSRFISVLLQPNGRHGNNKKFLDFFVAQIEKLKNFSVTSETLVFPQEFDKKENNNIDILVLNRKAKQCIIIENKINASDSNLQCGGQLQRYIDHAIYNELIPIQNVFVIYLTLDGHDPSAESINGYEDFDNIFIYSYEDLILPWLEECIKEVSNQPFLRESILQYIKLLQKMTGNSSRIEERLAYKELIGSSEENLRSTKKLIDNFKHIKWHAVFDFWFNFQEQISKESEIEIIKPFEKESYNSKQNNNCITDITHYEVYRKGQKEKQKCEIYLKIQGIVVIKIKYSAITDSFYFGIPEKDNESNRSMIISLINDYEEYVANSSKGLLLYKVFNNNIKFNDFTKEETFELINAEYSRQKVIEAVDEILNLSNRIIEKYA
ncbi:MAG: PD-(D/E)XK nuclease family protein [bacterium]